MLNTGDIVTPLDLMALDLEAFTEFGTLSESSLMDKRQVTVEHWLTTRLGKAGLPVSRHMTRRSPDKGYSVTSGGAFTPQTFDSKDTWLDVADLLVVPGTDALYVGMETPFRGLYVGMGDSVNANSLSISSVTYWNGGKWNAFSSVVDATYVSSSIAYSGGGRVMWRTPETWSRRAIGADSDWFYWVKLQLNRQPSTGTLINQLLPIRHSRLTTPAAMYSLGLMYRDAAVRTRGDWAEKGRLMMQDAETELGLVVTMVQDEFDVDRSESVSATEIGSVTPSTGFRWERG